MAYSITKPRKRKFLRNPWRASCRESWKASTEQSSPTAKPRRERRTRWRAPTSWTSKTGVWSRAWYLTSSIRSRKLLPRSNLPLRFPWLKFTWKRFRICWTGQRPIWKFRRTSKEVSLSKTWLSSPWSKRPKSTTAWKLAMKTALSATQTWTPSRPGPTHASSWLSSRRTPRLLSKRQVSFT